MLISRRHGAASSHQSSPLISTTMMPLALLVVVCCSIACDAMIFNSGGGTQHRRASPHRHRKQTPDTPIGGNGGDGDTPRQSFVMPPADGDKDSRVIAIDAVPSADLRRRAQNGDGASPTVDAAAASSVDFSPADDDPASAALLNSYAKSAHRNSFASSAGSALGFSSADENSGSSGGSGAVKKTSVAKSGSSSGGGEVGGASIVFAGCRDTRLTNIINTALRNYLHDMGQCASYILNQILRARYSGNWFVHAAQIQGQRQGVDWESKSNGDIFSTSSSHGCYYHDTETYLVVLHY